MHCKFQVSQDCFLQISDMSRDYMCLWDIVARWITLLLTSVLELSNLMLLLGVLEDSFTINDKPAALSHPSEAANSVGFLPSKTFFQNQFHVQESPPRMCRWGISHQLRLAVAIQVSCQVHAMPVPQLGAFQLRLWCRCTLVSADLHRKCQACSLPWILFFLYIYIKKEKHHRI